MIISEELPWLDQFSVPQEGFLQRLQDYHDKSANIYTTTEEYSFEEGIKDMRQALAKYSWGSI